jgi:hypothetical protein
MSSCRPIAVLVVPFVVACGAGLGPGYGGGGAAGAGALFGDTGGTGASSTGGAIRGSGGRAAAGAANLGGSGVGGRATGGAAVGGRATGGGPTGGRATGGTGSVVGSLTNTTWTMTLNCSGCCLGTLTFQASGTFVASCSYTPPLPWSQAGNTVTFSVNDGYATYVGTITGNTITGTASNINATTWPFTMTLTGA